MPPQALDLLAVALLSGAVGLHILGVSLSYATPGPWYEEKAARSASLLSRHPLEEESHMPDTG